MHHYLKTSESAHTVMVSLWTLSPVQGFHASGKQRWWSELYLLVCKKHACHLRMGQCIKILRMSCCRKIFFVYNCTKFTIYLYHLHWFIHLEEYSHHNMMIQFIHLRKLVPNWTIFHWQAESSTLTKASYFWMFACYSSGSQPCS